MPTAAWPSGSQQLMDRMGRSLQWDVGAACWRWVDAASGAVRSWAEGQAARSCRLPDAATLLAPCRSGLTLLAQAKRLCVADTWRAATLRHAHIAPLAMVDAAEPRTSISDGCTDRSGMLVFGTRNDGLDQRAIGSFFQYSRQHGLRRLALPAVAGAAGISVSPDGKRLYFADAREPRIYQCDYDAATALVSAIRPFAELDGAPGGSTVDAEGCVWNAQARAGLLVRYSPAGEVLRRVPIANGAHASPAFGGAALASLMIIGPGGLSQLPAQGAVGLAALPFDDQEQARITE